MLEAPATSVQRFECDRAGETEAVQYDNEVGRRRRRDDDVDPEDFLEDLGVDEAWKRGQSAGSSMSTSFDHLGVDEAWMREQSASSIMSSSFGDDQDDWKRQPSRLSARSRVSQKFQRTPSKEAALDRDPVLKVEDPELMRAMPMRTALRSQWLWGDSAGGKETFEMSRPVATIGTFLSHSWLTPGWLKVVGLAFYLNTPRAVAAAVFLHVVLHALELAGVYSFPIPPVYNDSRMFDGSDVVPSLRLQMHFVLPIVVFFVVLRYGQELPLGRRSCFLDKCCIHQTDGVKKAVGIKQLGAFLRYSDRMVVLWQPIYFTRLWCVYELAAFMHISGGDCRRVSFLPLKLSVFAVALSLFHSVATLCFCVLLPWTLLHPEHARWVAEAVPEAAQYSYLLLVCFGLSFVGLYALTSPFFWIFCKWHMRDRKELLQQVRSFEFDKAECREESDRTFVRGQIEHWFGEVAQFEHYVRTAVAERVEEMLHDQGPVPYDVVTVGVLSHVLMALTIAIHAVQDGIPNLVNICILLAGICFFTDAIALRLVMGLADTTFGDAPAGGHSLLGRLRGPLATATIFSACLSVPMALMTPAAPEWLAILLVVIVLVVTCMLYFPRRALNGIFRRRPEKA